jgi:hypothetical protein
VENNNHNEILNFDGIWYEEFAPKGIVVGVSFGFISVL